MFLNLTWICVDLDPYLNFFLSNTLLLSYFATLMLTLSSSHGHKYLNGPENLSFYVIFDNKKSF